MSNEPDQVNSGALFTSITLVAFATLAVALVVTALVRDTTAKVLADKDQTQERPLRDLVSKQVGSLTAAPAWTDKAKGLVSVPIDQAMTMVVEKLRANPYALSPGFVPPKKECECEKSDDDAEADESSSSEAVDDELEASDEECECEEETEEEEETEADEETSDDSASESETASATAKTSELKLAPKASPSVAPQSTPSPAAPAPSPEPVAPAPAPAPAPATPDE